MGNGYKIVVPLKFDGFECGTATLSESNGVIYAEFALDKSNIGREIRDIFLHGMADSLSIRPNYIPAVPKETPNG